MFQSKIGSRASQRSKASNVDETLFGGKGTNASKGLPQNATVVSLDEIRSIRNKTLKNNQNDAVIISKSDMERIK